MSELNPIKTLPLLLKPIRGKVRVWQIRVVDKGDFAVIQTEYGQQGSKITVTEKEVKSGKNIGRSNETTPYQQALLEAKAAWTLVKKDGYVEDLTTFKPTMKPMSYHTFMDNLKKVTWPAITQPKLEGIHCVVRRCGNSIAYMSRELNLFSTLDYMTDHLLAILEDGEEVSMELYAHDTTDLTAKGVPDHLRVSYIQRVYFEDIVSLVKDPDSEELRRILLKGYVFDLNSPNIPVERRLEVLSHRIEMLQDDSPIIAVPFYEVDSLEEFLEMHEEFKQDGYEGSVYKRMGSLYQHDYRSYDVLKHKDMISLEFPIVDVIEGVGRFKGKAVFVCRADNGATFSVITAGKADLKEKYLRDRNTLIGTGLTVQYQRLTKKGVPYLPVGLAPRNYE